MIKTVLQTLAVLLLAGFGQLFQMRLSESMPSLTPLMLGLLVGIVLAFLVAKGRIDQYLVGRSSWVVGGLTMLVLVALLVVGRRYRGGLYLPGRINPSELVKLGTVLFVSGQMAVNGGRLSVKLLLGVGGICLLAAAAGDFGLVAQLVLTCAVMLFAVSWFWGVAAFGVIGAGAFFAALFPVGHLATRFAVWRDPLADATGTGWQTLQGLVAVFRGGFAGVGYGAGHADQVPIVTSDFVYAALAEDFGLVGCAVILVVWAFVLVRALETARQVADEGRLASSLVATGLTASLSVQIVLNIAGVLNALPMTGIPLPLISHGGSSLIVTLAMCGILVGLSSSAVSPKPSSGARTRGGRGSAGGTRGNGRSPRPGRRCNMSPSRS